MLPRPAALFLFLLALLAELDQRHVGAAASTSTGLRRGSRALRAAAPAVAPGSGEPPPLPAPAPAPDAAVDISQPGTIIETLVDQKCSVIHRALLVGRELVAAADNLQPDAVSCCQSCLARQDECNAWSYCPEAAGCAVGASPGVLAAAAAAGDGAGALRAPFRGCRLLTGPAFRLHKDSPEVALQGPGVPFISGTPVTISLPMLPNYSVRPGTDLARGLGYACEESLVYSGCIIQGKVEDLAALCDADPRCKAFVYLPNGVDSLSDPIGILKGGEDSIPVSALKPNPATALYLKSSVATITDSKDGGSSSTTDACGGHACSCRSSTTLWIVLPTLLAAALIMVAAVAVYATVAMRQQARARAEAAAAAAAAAADKPRSGKPSPPGSGGVRPTRAGSGGSRPTPPGTGKRASPPGSGLSGGGVTAIAPGAPVPLPACLTVHLLKASPPNSGASNRSGQGVGSEHSSASRMTCGTSAGVPCPQCGSVLGIAAAAPVLVVPRQPHTPTRRAQHAQQQQQQQLSHQHAQQQQQQLSQQHAQQQQQLSQQQQQLSQPRAQQQQLSQPRAQQRSTAVGGGDGARQASSRPASGPPPAAPQPPQQPPM